MADDGPSQPMWRLLGFARSVLAVTQADLGAELGCSARTVLRWESGRSRPTEGQVIELADRVRVEDEDLADALLASAGVLVMDRQEPPALVAQPASLPPGLPALVAQPASLPPGLLAEAVVYAAAQAIDAAPRIAKTAVVAAFARASALGLSVETVLEGLREESP